MDFGKLLSEKKLAHSISGQAVGFGTNSDNSVKPIIFYRSQSSLGGGSSTNFETQNPAGASIFGKPTVRDIINEDKFIQSLHTDSK